MLGFFANAQSRLFRARPWAPRLLVRTFRQSEDGQAVVELALALPVLLIVVLGIVDFGRAVNYWNNDNDLANLAARYAAVDTLPTLAEDPTCGNGPSLTATKLTEYVQCKAGIDSTELKNGSGTSTGVQGGLTVKVSVPKEATVGSPVTVEVVTTYSWLPLPKVLGGTSPKFANTTLCGIATMRLEQAPPEGASTAPPEKCP